MFVIAAGMPRSGSTWLYNVLRVLLLDNTAPDVKCLAGWIDDIPWKENESNILVKVHNPIDELFDKADLVFYSYRDLRDVLASQQRKFGNIPSIELAGSLIKNDLYWSDRAVYSMKYETMIAAPEKVIDEICRVLQFATVDSQQVLKQINRLSYQTDGDKNERYHKGNLYHQGHITNGKEGSWKGELSSSLVNELEQQYGNWFIERDYRFSN